MGEVQAAERAPMPPQALEPQETKSYPLEAASLYTMRKVIEEFFDNLTEVVAQLKESTSSHKRDQNEKIEKIQDERRSNTYSQMGCDIVGGGIAVALGLKDASCSNAMNTVVGASSAYHNTVSSEIQQKMDKTTKGMDSASEAKRSASEMTKTTHQYLERMVDEHDRVIHKPVID